MKLTDKAKESYFQWRKENGYEVTFSQSSSQGNAESLDKLYQIYENALIIDWLDSVGVYIIPFPVNRGNDLTEFSFEIVFKGTHNRDFDSYFNSRPEAIESAIIKANEIFNELNK